MLYVREAYNMVQSLCTKAIEPHYVRRLYVFPNCERRDCSEWSTSPSDFNPAIPATGWLKCRCTKGGACSSIRIYHATMVLQPCYTPNRQRQSFEWIENGYRRSVVWLEPLGCSAIGERLKGCFFLPRRTALIPHHPYSVPPTQGIFIVDARHLLRKLGLNDPLPPLTIRPCYAVQRLV